MDGWPLGGEREQPAVVIHRFRGFFDGKPSRNKRVRRDIYQPGGTTKVLKAGEDLQRS